MAKISIILPSLNVKSYIEKCMDSVLAQTLKDIEIICVDAGSTDGTLEILYDYARHDRRVRVICSQVKSYGRQMNIGILEAQGKYIGIVETDDYVEPAMFETLYREAAAKKVQVVKCEYFYSYILNSGKRIEEKRRYIPDYIRPESFSPEMEPEIHIWDSYIWDAIYAKDFLVSNQIMFSETAGAAYQDIGFKHRVLNFANSVVYLKTPLYHYLVTRKDASSRNRKCIEYVYTEYKSLLEDKRMRTCYLAGLYSSMVQSFFREYKKTIEIEAEDVQTDIYDEILKWFHKQFDNCFEKSCYSRRYMSDDEKQELENFVLHTKDSIAAWKMEAALMKKWFYEFSDHVGDRDIILVGCTPKTKRIRDFFLKSGLSLTGVIDRNKEIHGKPFGPFEIMDPQMAIHTFEKAVYFIVNDDEDEDICIDLKKWGVGDESLYVLDGEYRVIPDICFGYAETL